MEERPLVAQSATRSGTSGIRSIIACYQKPRPQRVARADNMPRLDREGSARALNIAATVPGL
jgi:hypothetical protein